MIKNIKDLENHLNLPEGSLEKAFTSEEEVEIAIPEPKTVEVEVEASEEFDVEGEEKAILPFAHKMIVVDLHMAEESKPKKRFDTSKLKLFKEGMIVEANFAIEQNKLDKGRIYEINVAATKKLNADKDAAVAAKKK